MTVLISQPIWRGGFWLSLIVILYLTLTPQPPHPIDLNQVDKIYHAIGFAGFAFICAMAWRRLSWQWILVICCLLGITIEIAQYFIPNRGFSLLDWAADTAGALIGIVIVFWVRKKRG